VQEEIDKPILYLNFLFGDLQLGNIKLAFFAEKKNENLALMSLIFTMKIMRLAVVV